MLKYIIRCTECNKMKPAMLKPGEVSKVNKGEIKFKCTYCNDSVTKHKCVTNGNPLHTKKLPKDI